MRVIALRTVVGYPVHNNRLIGGLLKNGNASRSNSKGSAEGWETYIRVRPVNRTLILTH